MVEADEAGDEAACNDNESMLYDRLARRYLVGVSYKGVRTLHYWRDSFWLWTKRKPVYVAHTEKEMIDAVLLSLRQQQISSLIDTASKVMACIRSDVRLRDVERMPAWLGTMNKHANHICLSNGVLDPMDIVKGRYNILMNHTPLLFTRTKLPYKYVATAECPRWLDFLGRTFKGDPDSIALLQEWFGYIITPDTSRNVALLLIGDGATGKSTILKVMGAMLGDTLNCTYLPADEMGEEYAMAAAQNKTLMISHEMKQKVSPRMESVFKWYVGGDAMNVNDKYKSRVDAEVKPTARLAIAANEFPEFHDTTGAIYRRILPLHCRHVVPPAERDLDLEVKLRRELSGIFLWAARGLKRLLDKGFSRSEAGLALLDRSRAINQGWVSFVEDCVSEVRDCFVSSGSIMVAYAKWCEANGMGKVASIEVLKDEIRKKYPAVVERRMRSQVRGRQERGLLGVKVAY